MITRPTVCDRLEAMHGTLTYFVFAKWCRTNISSNKTFESSLFVFGGSYLHLNPCKYLPNHSSNTCRALSNPLLSLALVYQRKSCYNLHHFHIYGRRNKTSALKWTKLATLAWCAKNTIENRIIATVFTSLSAPMKAFARIIVPEQ